MKKPLEIKKNAPEMSIEEEMDKLKTILIAIESLNGAQRERVFKYLKNRYSSAWPSDQY